MHLENATVRASAVSTLAKFGAMVDSLKVLFFLMNCVFSFAPPFSVLFGSEFSLLLLVTDINILSVSSMFQPRVFILLRRCLFDSDDEVSYMNF